MKSNQKEYESFKEIIDESKVDLSGYFEKRLMLVKLQVREKLASTFSHIVYSLIVSSFVVIISFLVFIALGFFLGELLNNYALGFGSLGLVIIIALFIILLNKRKIRRILTNLILITIKKIEQDED